MTGNVNRLAAHLAGKLEAERARIARRLHGDVAGMLAAARMDLSRIASRSTEDADLHEQILRVDRLLEQVIQAARAEMQRLHPALLDHFGLPAALRHRVEEISRAAGAEYALELPETVDGLEPACALAAYRVVEALLAENVSLRRVSLKVRETAAGCQLDVEVEHADPLSVEVRDDLGALRAWLESFGASWVEVQRVDRSAIELTLPRTAGGAGATPGS